jgi:hypothetical protein
MIRHAFVTPTTNVTRIQPVLMDENLKTPAALLNRQELLEQ